MGTPPPRFSAPVRLRRGPWWIASAIRCRLTPTPVRTRTPRPIHSPAACAPTVCLGPWPKGYPGYSKRRPAVFTSSVTSTLSANMLNEARFGWRKNQLVIYPVFERPDNEAARKAGQDLLLQGGQGFPISFTPGVVAGMNPAAYLCQTFAVNSGAGCAQQGNRGPLTTYADTLSWIHGKHAFKWGGEYRSEYTNGWATPTAPIPQ